MIILVIFEEISKLIRVAGSLKRDSVLYSLLPIILASISFEIFAEVDSTGQVPFSFLGPVLLFWREKILILKIS